MQRLSSLARYYTHAQKSGRKAHAYNNSTMSQKTHNKTHFETLLSRSLSLCEESLDCMNLCRAALAAARDTQTSPWPHTHHHFTFPSLVHPWYKLHFMSAVYGKECVSQRYRVQREREETLLVAGDCSVWCTDWNGVEQNVLSSLYQHL